MKEKIRFLEIAVEERCCNEDTCDFLPKIKRYRYLLRDFCFKCNEIHDFFIDIEKEMQSFPPCELLKELESFKNKMSV